MFPALPFLDIYLKKMKTSSKSIFSNLKRCMHPMFIAASFAIAKTGKQPVSTDGWIEKENVIAVSLYLDTGILFSHIKEGNPVICNKMDVL